MSMNIKDLYKLKQKLENDIDNISLTIDRVSNPIKVRYYDLGFHQSPFDDWFYQEDTDTVHVQSSWRDGEIYYTEIPASAFTTNSLEDARFIYNQYKEKNKFKDRQRFIEKQLRKLEDEKARLMEEIE